MARIELTIDEPLLSELDEAARRQHAATNDYVLDLIRAAIERDLGQREAKLYRELPPTESEMGFEADDTDWGHPWNPKPE